MDMQLPVGFQFHPMDEELVIHYLCRKCTSQPIFVPIIVEIDLYKHDPWHLLALYGEKEWYFFSHREQKYPNGSRPNRSAGSGYWKATGTNKPIGRPKPVRIKKALVFYIGKAPRGQKTNWIMHEYRLADVDRSANRNITSRKKCGSNDIMYLDASESILGSGSGEKQPLEVESSPKLFDYWENSPVNFSFIEYIDTPAI